MAREGRSCSQRLQRLRAARPDLQVLLISRQGRRISSERSCCLGESGEGLADELLAVARRLEPDIDALWAQMSRWRQDPTAVSPPSLGIVSIDFMLVGFAVENLLKARLVEAHSSEVREAFKKSLELPRCVKSHDLASMAKNIDFSMSIGEESLMRRLSRAVRWVGRYPVPTTADGLASGEVFSDGRKYLVSYFGAEDVAQVQKLIGRLTWA